MKKYNTRKLREVIGTMLRKLEKGASKKGSAVIEAWAAVVGEKAKDHAYPVNLKNGILMVIVENSSWLYKLTLEKQRLMRDFNNKYRGRKKVSDIRFRVGVVEEHLVHND